MAIIQVPFHQDEHVAESSIPVQSGTPCYPVTPLLPEGDLWERLAYLYQEVAVEVEKGQAGHGADRPFRRLHVSMGVLTGLQRAGIDPAIVWFDAHGDVHTMESSTSGYPGGMSLEFLTGSDYALLGGTRVPAGHHLTVLLVDARDLDPAEPTTCGHPRSSSARSMPSNSRTAHSSCTSTPRDRVRGPRLRYPVGNGPSKEAVLTALREIRATDRVSRRTSPARGRDDESLLDAATP